jgi:alpha-tubulin suppressor-like RCC1 family protein
MSYTGIGATDPNHPLEVEGQVFISNVEAGSASQDVPFEVYSDYTGNSGLTDSRQLRLRVTPSATTTTNVHVDMGINNTDGDYFFISEPVTGATTVGTKTTFTINQDGNVGVGSNLSVTGNVVTSNIVGGSPLTISTGSNVQILTSNVGIGTVVDPVSNTRVHIQGGSHASITNSNAFPNFIFSRNVDATKRHTGSGHNTARHAMFPDEDGRVWAAGHNQQGSLGLGDNVYRNKFTLVSALDGVANIVASCAQGQGADTYTRSYLLDDTGNVWTCGNNDVGQLGLGDQTNRYTPTLISNSNIYNVSITEVSGGAGCALLLDSTGQMWGAGYNDDYRMGHLSGYTGGAATTFIPTLPSGSSPGDYSFTSIECGDPYSLAIQDNGRLWSTGNNADGRAGGGGVATVTGWTLCPDGTTTNPALSAVTIEQICAGINHSLAMDSTGNVWATGYNVSGNLGLGDTSNRNYFERVTTNVNAQSGATAYKIAAGVGRSYVLDTNGKMWHAGYNDGGSGGNPPYTLTISTFVRADTGPIASKSITDFGLASFASVVARTSDNEYYVTGNNEWGQLGTGFARQHLFVYTKLLDVNANPPPDYGYTRSLLLENTETGKGPSIELKNKNAVSSRIQMEDGTSGKLNIGFVDASYDPKLSGGDGAELYPFQDFTQSNTMTRGVTINQAGGTMVAGGSTSNIGFNVPVISGGLPGTAKYGYGAGYYGGDFTIFITTEGKLYFAGENSNGQAGNGTTNDTDIWIESTPPNTLFPIVGVAQGYSHSMALDSKGQLWGAGYNLNGSLGLGNNTDPISSWTANTSIGITRVVACGNDFTMRITPTGLLETTGGANNYKNGTGTGTPTNYFTSANTGVLVGYTVKNVWASDLCTFALRSDDKLCVAGYNVSGETGSSLSPTQSNQYFVLCTDTNFSAESPVELSSAREFGFGAHTMMITASGKIYGAGDGANYRTGLNSTTDVNIFTQCTGGIDSVTVTQVATTEQASIAMDSTGNVWITGLAVVNGLSGTAGNSDSQQFVKITEPAEFYSKTIVNVMGGYDNTFYALDSEGTMWGVGQYIRGLGQGSDGYKSKLFNKLPIYDIVPKEFKYTPTLTLENPNPDHGATVEFKNPNNQAVINLDDKTSSLRLGFVNNKNNAGQFKGLQIAADGSLFGGIGIGTTNFFNRNFIVDGPNASLEVSAANENQTSTIYLGTPFRYRVEPYPSPPKAAIVAEGISNYSRSKLHFCVEDTASNDAQYIAGVDNARMTITRLGHVGIGTTDPENALHIYGVNRDETPDVHGLHLYTNPGFQDTFMEWVGTGSHYSDYLNPGNDYRGRMFYAVGVNSWYWYVDGNHRALLNNGGGFYAVFFGILSDRRLKDDITDIDDEASLDIISKLQPKTFYVKNNPGQKRWGFIADEVQELVPEAIETQEQWDLPVDKSYPALWRAPEIVTATIEDATYEVGDKFRFTNNLERHDRNSSFVVKSKTGNDYTFEYFQEPGDKSVQQLGTDTINIRSKMIKDVKVLNREFIDPVMVSAMQQMLRKIESLEARVATLENNSA